LARRGWQAAFVALLFLLLLWLPGSASAHVANIVAKISLVGDSLTVTFLDPYNVPIDQLAVTASVEALGGKPGNPIKLTEGQPGTYTGRIPPAPADKYQVTILFELAKDQHQVILTAERGKDQPEVLLPVLSLGADSVGGSNYEVWLFGGAILVLAAATAYALYRTPKDPDEEVDHP
jgi:hypothetical protein